MPWALAISVIWTINSADTLAGLLRSVPLRTAVKKPLHRVMDTHIDILLSAGLIGHIRRQQPILLRVSGDRAADKTESLFVALDSSSPADSWARPGM
jgi:hypothetical protein